MNRLVKNVSVLTLIHLFSISYGLPDKGTIIEIKGKSYKYSILIPANWDTIPLDTLAKRFGKGLYDAGLYSTTNKNYFDGEYIQYSFLPTNISLSQLTFAQIVKEFRSGINSTNKLPGNDKIVELSVDSFIEDNENKVFYMAGKISSGIKERKYTQMIVPTKFGILKIIYYEAKDATPKSMTNNSLFAAVSIAPDFKYVEPSSKSNLNIWHIIIAFSIGLAVYFIIQYSPKIRRSSKQTN
jgi:hypothetical protein